VDEMNVRFGMLVVLFGAVVTVSAVLGEADTRYTTYTVEEVLEERPIGEEVRVEGRVSGEIERLNQSGRLYRRFAIGEEKRLMVYCSLFNGRLGVSMGDNVSVTGRFTTYREVLQVSTQCYRVRGKG